MPNNEDVWQRRTAHRLEGVAAVKRSPDYREMVIAEREHGVERPPARANRGSSSVEAEVRFVASGLCRGVTSGRVARLCAQVTSSGATVTCLPSRCG